MPPGWRCGGGASSEAAVRAATGIPCPYLCLVQAYIPLHEHIFIGRSLQGGSSSQATVSSHRSVSMSSLVPTECKSCSITCANWLSASRQAMQLGQATQDTIQSLLCYYSSEVFTVLHSPLPYLSSSPAPLLFELAWFTVYQLHLALHQSLWLLGKQKTLQTMQFWTAGGPCSTKLET